jgi:hypothetical protein
LIVPHQLVKAMGQIWIISKAVYSVKSSTEKEEKSSRETSYIETQSKVEVEKVE